MIDYIKMWWCWATHCSNSWPHKILALIIPRYSPSFHSYKLWNNLDWNKYSNGNGGNK